MYKFKSKQISFSDFGQPVGMEMIEDNRWIKKADAIPWEQIELKYAKLFANSQRQCGEATASCFGGSDHPAGIRIFR